METLIICAWLVVIISPEYTRIETRFGVLLRAVENWNVDMKDRRKTAKPIKGGGTVGQRSPDTVL
jgi:hypothetical protein